MPLPCHHEEAVLATARRGGAQVPFYLWVDSHRVYSSLVDVARLGFCIQVPDLEDLDQRVRTAGHDVPVAQSTTRHSCA